MGVGHDQPGGWSVLTPFRAKEYEGMFFLEVKTMEQRHKPWVSFRLEAYAQEMASHVEHNRTVINRNVSCIEVNQTNIKRRLSFSGNYEPRIKARSA